MAGRARRNVPELGSETTRIRFRRRGAEVCRLRRFAHRGETRGSRIETNYSSSNENSLRLGVTEKGKDTKALVIAASVAGLADAAEDLPALADFLRGLHAPVGRLLPRLSRQDRQPRIARAALQQAYDWARISTIQGLVNNPYLGAGLVAGYRTSGVGQRPGFAWFFGRDSLWTSFALNAEGDYPTTRTALDFIGKYQREDGKVPHEISQSASLVPWFKDYPYALRFRRRHSAVHHRDE